MAENTRDTDRTARPIIVGIGASAGGVQALKVLFETLPKSIDAAFVVIVHLDPEHVSELPHILAGRTAMPVLQVNERLALQAGTVYVIPPGRRLLISGSDIATAPFDEPRGLRTPIDLFFRSLAEQHGDGFAVILSGSGSDGAVGVRAIKENGGIIFVQDPNEAEYPMMPRAAMASGADFVLPAARIGAQLAELIHVKAHVPAEPLDAPQKELVQRVLTYLRSKTGQDFTKYKRATVMRRLARRMQVTQSDSLEHYLSHLRESVEEVRALFNDLLISVTSFFRDPDAYRALATTVIPRLFDRGKDDDPIRVWVPGCATGEEAYSIAILMLEEAARRDVRPDIQIFASDLDGSGLATAREGRYPTAISNDVSEERLRRYFTREGEHYRIRREVRDLVVFANHGLMKDPPFSRLDLVSCRNLLIYLDRDLQQQACGVFHYALRPRGYLFLGTSESADSPPGLFFAVDREARIYQASERPRDKLPPLPRSLTMLRIPEIPVAARPNRSASSLDSALHRQALEELAPPSMLVDENHVVVNLSESAGRYLLHPSGPVSNDAAEIVRPELRLDIRAALHRAFEHNEGTLSLPIPVRFNGTPQAIVVQVRPVMRDHHPRSALVFFIDGGPVESMNGDVTSPGEDSTVVTHLREELLATRTLLRTTREQYETATEELRAANEELQSINEEYRSTAEELETSKEELQSTNEELQTLNNELKLKLDMVSRAHNDLQNLMSATDFGALFLDTSLRIKRFTPRTSELFNVAAGDEGRSVTDFTHRLDYQDLVADGRRVLADLAPIERTIRSVDSRWFMMRIRPYRTLDDKIEGVVATFVDVTERREAEAAWTARQQLLLQELSHRVKNILSVVHAITSQTLSKAGVPAGVQDAIDGRLQALATAHDLLVRNEWRGASLEALARDQLASFTDPAQLRVNGPSVILPPALATPMGLVLHELGTNSAKYGALASRNGAVELSWRTEQLEDGHNDLKLVWKEEGGSSPPTQPASGLGTDLIDNAIADALVHREWTPRGLIVTIDVPLRPVPNRSAVLWSRLT